MAKQIFLTIYALLLRDDAYWAKVQSLKHYLHCFEKENLQKKNLSTRVKKEKKASFKSRFERGEKNFTIEKIMRGEIR